MQKRFLRETMLKALEAYQIELAEIQQHVADIKEKIAALEEELGLEVRGSHRRGRKRRGKDLPFGSKDVAQLQGQVSSVSVDGKKPIEAARLIYQAVGKPLHAALVYQVLVTKGYKLKAKTRPEDVFASYLRRSDEFERVQPGVFKLKAGQATKTGGNSN